MFNKEIWKQKYRYNDERAPEDTFMRIANFAATNDPEWRDKFFQEMNALRFIPGGRILAGAGTDRKKSTLSNCFVMSPVPDSMTGIMQALNESALTMQAGGGIGVDFSELRPKGALVKGTGSESSGPVSFMRMWDAMCSTVAAAGNRRGAMMGVMRIDHPDIMRFITAKDNNSEDNKVLSQFNLSVAITDDFMEAVINDTEFELKFNGKVYKTVKARTLWNMIIESNYKKSEPGVLFIDRVNKQNNLWYCEHISAVNPCGEQPLSPYSSCNLGAINITQFIVNPFTEEAGIDYQLMEDTVKTGIRFLDNILDLNYYPLQKQKEEVEKKRKVGLGIMGLGSALAMLRIRYADEKSIQIVEKIMQTIRDTAYRYSTELSDERGAFPLFDSSKHLQGEFIKKLPDSIRKEIEKKGIRNSHLLTIAPTGSIAQLVANVSGGVEPIFSLEYIRKNYELETAIRDYAYGMYTRLNGNSKATPEYFVTAHDLTPEQHLQVMSTCQKYIDASISKTINLPENISVKEMEEIYTKAYKMRCKGCTTFREGSLEGILKLVPYSDTGKEKSNKTQSNALPQRPYRLEGQTFKVKLPEQRHAYYLTFTHEVNGEGSKKKPYELFINTKDPLVEEWTKALGRLVSAVFRNVEHPIFIVDEFKEVYAQSGFFSSQRRKFVPSLIAEFGEVMKDYFTNISLIEPEVPIEEYVKEINGNSHNDRKLAYCKLCGQHALVFEEGCIKCLACDYDKCG